MCTGLLQISNIQTNFCGFWGKLMIDLNNYLATICAGCVIQIYTYVLYIYLALVEHSLMSSLILVFGKN